MEPRTFSQMPRSRPSRRAIYRVVKKKLRHALWRTWTGTSSALNRALQRLLRGRSRSELLRLARRPAVAALLLAGATVASPAVHADAVELSDIALGNGGFAVRGAAAVDYSGRSVSGAGDVNGDGMADLIIGAWTANPNGTSSGSSYVVFGKADGTSIELSDIADGTGGFAMHGAAMYDYSGRSVSGAGDVNGDGLADLIIGAPGADINGFSSGTSYVVFGKEDGTAVELSDIALGIGGFAIHGAKGSDRSSFSVSGAGDVNGDGMADLIVGAYRADPNGTNSGSSYVVFGKADGTSVELSDIADGTGGFAMHGAATYDFSGRSVSGAGDVNGDGMADLIVGARYADPNGYFSGSSYVVFGKTDGTAVELSGIALGNGGFALHGEAAHDYSGFSVSGAGDVNGDGMADLIVGAPDADPNGYFSGSSYVVFGKMDGTAVELSDIALGNGGFALHGEAANDYSGTSVSGVGDVNGDGMADLIVGVPEADSGSGTSYVVFGKADGATVQLSDIALGTGGFALHGEVFGDRSGISVSGAGDVNGDGMADLIVGAPFADSNGSSSGTSYVVFSVETPDSSSIYFLHTRAGDGPGGGIVPETVFEDGRMKVDFGDDDLGDDGSGGASLEGVVLYRSGDVVNNLVSPNLTLAQADVAWQMLTDRVNWTDARLTVKYTDTEIAAMAGSETHLKIFSAPALDGPWSEENSTLDATRNELSFETGFSADPIFLAVGLGTGTFYWVNFGHAGAELGSRELPFNTLQEAVDAVSAGGTIRIDGASSVKTTSATPTLNKPMRIEAVDGKVTIGTP